MIARGLAAVIVGLALAAVVDAGPARIQIISIQQTRTMEPSAVTVFVRVPPAPANRGVWYLVDCRRDDGLSTRSFQQLEGAADEPRPLSRVFRLMGCVYSVQAVLVGEGGRVLERSDVRTVRVLCGLCDRDRDEEEPDAR